MTIDKAIEVNQVTLDDEFTTLHLDQLDAIRLGEEALKVFQRRRKAHAVTMTGLLPGETKE